MFDMPIQVESELPRFTLRQIDLPDVEYWEVGGQYYIIMKVEMTAKRVRKDLPMKEDQQKIEGDFMMLNIKPLGDEPVDAESLAQADFEIVTAKANASRRE